MVRHCLTVGSVGLKSKRTQVFVLSVALLSADASEERKKPIGGNDSWFIALSVAIKTRKMQWSVLSAELVYMLVQLGELDAGDKKKKNKNASDFPTVAYSWA